MDLSKVTDSQRQQLEQLQKQFQEHQQKQQQEESAAAVAAAVQQPPPAYDPSQAYDQSYYYNYNYQDASEQRQPQQYDASYYHNYYSNAYQKQQQQQQLYTSEQQRNEGSGSGSLGLGQPNPGYAVPQGLNAAAANAVAALSHLTQYADTMGATERAMSGGGGYGPPMVYGQGHFRPPGGRGGRQGGGPFRGGGRGNSGFRPPNTGGSGPPSHGRGRGRGSRGRGGRRGPPSGASSSAVEAADSQQPTRVAWCELCKVDCTSKEILEQHNNGKRHKKNLQLQNMKSAYQPVVETEKDEKPVSDIGPEPNKNVHVNETKAGGNDNKVEKRKMRGGSRGGGRGGAKRQRLAATGPSKRKVVIPLMCELCNVKCDTQEVFGRHAVGKKHMAKLKRFEGHQAIYGPTAVQALYPPNPLSQTLGPQPAYYGASGPYPGPPEGYIPPTHQAQNPNPELANAPLEFGTRNAVPEPQVAQVSTGERHAGNGV